MAKRYAEYDSLPEGYFKPEGTLGRHHCTVAFKGDEKVVIGSEAGKVTLKPGDTLGYDCGQVWLVPRPDSYKDPLRRVLALAKISQKVLVYSDDPVRYTISYGRSLPGASADVETGDRPLAVLGEYTDREVPGTDRDAPDKGEYLGAFSFEKEITGGDAIVISSVASFESTTAHRRRRVSRVVVRTLVDKAKVAEWLEGVITPRSRI